MNYEFYTLKMNWTISVVGEPLTWEVRRAAHTTWIGYGSGIGQWLFVNSHTVPLCSVPILKEELSTKIYEPLWKPFSECRNKDEVVIIYKGWSVTLVDSQWFGSLNGYLETFRTTGRYRFRICFLPLLERFEQRKWFVSLHIIHSVLILPIYISLFGIFYIEQLELSSLFPVFLSSNSSFSLFFYFYMLQINSHGSLTD